MTPQRREASSASDSDLERTVACTMLSDQIGADQIRNSCKSTIRILRKGGGCKGKVQCYRRCNGVCSDAVAVNNRRT